MTTLNDSGQPIGLTVNSFASLSLCPPLILWSLQAGSRSTEYFGVGRAFAVNVLAHNQADVSQRFASARADKFFNTAHVVNDAGFVHLEGVLASFECRTESAQAAGDHILFVAKVLRFLTNTPGPAALQPLLFYNGGYHSLGGALT